MPEITIVIPTYNRSKLLSRTVAQVLGEQNLRDLEVIIVDQSEAQSRAENEAFVAAINDERVRYLHLATKGHPNARNEGVARARAPVILFLDDDVVLLRPDFLEAHLRAYDDPTVGGVTGRIVERVIRPNTRRTMCRVASSGRIITNLSGRKPVLLETLKGANMSYRASVFQQVGGFDRNFVGAYLEDGEFSTRVRKAGWKLLFEPRAELFHLYSPNGGVRVKAKTPGQILYWRFRSTTYFMLKCRRRPLPMACFVLTFGAIAVHRTVKWRSLEILPAMWRAVREGINAWRCGSDDKIPDLP